ncbi:MAG: TRAP transporter small permease subunit [Xanthobacteraceae bacterium]|nr:TRAP transporter small permease subunit [Xanthobacteraceae bacterium]PWB64768.1 MAG: transporter [Bradyrhizobiaceae bacterium]
MTDRIDEAGAAPPPSVVRLVRTIDGIAIWSGRIFCLLAVPLVVAITYEVLARYMFRAPTIWAYDVAYMLYGSHFMLGAAYTLYRGGHIRTDIFYMTWSVRTRGIIDATLYLLLFFPGMALFFWMGLQEALQSFDIREVSDASPWRPIIYPFKAVIPISIVLLLIQGVSEFLKSAYAAKTGREL